MVENMLQSVYSDYKQFDTYNKRRSAENKRNDDISMSKINKKTPLYITDKSETAKETVFDIKKASSDLFLNLERIIGKNSKSNSILDKKLPESSNENIVSVEFIDKEINIEDAKEHDIYVEKLATKQVNIGNFIKNKTTKLEPGVHLFDICISSGEYQFQFNTEKGENDLQIQERLSNLINKSNLGISSDIIHDGLGQCAIRISANETGKRSSDNLRFEFKEYENDNIISYYGIDHVNNEPENSVFWIDDDKYTNSSNSFEFDDIYNITMHNVSTKDGEITHIKVSNDTDSIIKNINKIADNYNNFTGKIIENSDLKGYKQILNEIGKIVDKYQENFNKIGIDTVNKYFIKVDNNLLSESILNENDISAVNDFLNDLKNKSKEISLNPINYIDKRIVEYKDISKQQFNSPYVTNSLYSGMFLNKIN